MIILLSPSKTQDFEQPMPPVPATQPRFLDDSAQLVALLRRLGEDELAALMDISPRLAALNHARFREWASPFTHENSRPAGHAFQGDVYTGLAFGTLDRAAQNRAQARLRILSGLYGVLRPFDLIRPYRLEMGIPLPNPRGRNLYEFWGDRLAESLRRDADDGLCINLASQEYAKAAQPGRFARCISPVFKERRGNTLQMIALMAKKARGAMARWLLEENVVTAADVTGFDRDGYRYDRELTMDANAPVFVRSR